MSYKELRLYAEMFFDVQEFRKAAENKVRSQSVDAKIVADKALEHYQQAEHDMSLQMRRCLRRTAPAPVLTWLKAEKGIGEHLLARLLGVIGDPRVATPYHWEGTGKANRILVADESYERTVSQLWSYCGHGDPERKRYAKMDAEDALACGNPTAKMLVWNMAKAAKIVCTSHLCLRCGKGKISHVKGGKGCADPEFADPVATGHWGEVYLKRRFVTRGRVHAKDCVRCGPKGHPAAAGSPWSAAHKEADALRIVGKEILRDLWVVAG